MPERDERLYLDDIVRAIDRILSNTAEGRDAFFADSLRRLVAAMVERS